MKKILSIDGGGIRGIIPALLLAEIENRTKMPCTELFNMFAGTSTGGIIALALNIPDEQGKPKYTAADIVKLYETNGKEIFKNPRPFILRLFMPKYNAKNIEKVLEHYFENTSMLDSIKPLLIPAYEISTNTAFFFKSSKADKFRKDSNLSLYMKDIARATSAAPTYFAPACFKIFKNKHEKCFIDGGVFANNPTMCAISDILKKDKNKDDIFVLSLGTGLCETAECDKKNKTYGIVGWATEILNTTLDGISDTVNYQTREILDKSNYYRLQPNLTKSTSKMDNIKPENLALLIEITKNYIAENSAKIDEICNILLK